MNKSKHAPSEGQQMEAVIARLRDEKMECDIESFDSGKDDAADWAKEAGYADLKIWTATACQWLEEVGAEWAQFRLPEECTDYVLERRDSIDGFEYDAYARGWCEGVHDFMIAVRKRL